MSDTQIYIFLMNPDEHDSLAVRIRVILIHTQLISNRCSIKYGIYFLPPLTKSVITC